MSDPDPTGQSALTTEAADWYARLRAADVSEMDAVRFRAWLARDPAHRREFEALDGLWEVLGGLEHSGEMARERSAGSAGRFRWRPLAVAASLALAVAASIWMLARTGDHYTTGVGEQRVVPLADGSVVTLNTSTELKLHYSQGLRGVELISGQANFEVAKDPGRPFVVTAGGGEVRAVGTQFDVYKAGDQVTVTLLEGKVAVVPRHASPGGQVRLVGSPNGPEAGEPGAGTAAARRREEIFLTAGQQLSYAARTGRVRHARVDVSRASAWRSRKLDFDDALLSDAIAEVNRYSRVKIELRAPQLHSARISGSFEAGKSELFVEGVQAYFGLDAVRTEDDRIVLTASP